MHYLKSYYKPIRTNFTYLDAVVINSLINVYQLIERLSVQLIPNNLTHIKYSFINLILEQNKYLYM